MMRTKSGIIILERTEMTDKKIAKRLQLTSRNETYEKFGKLQELAEELGIRIIFHGNNRVELFDKDRDGTLPTLYIEDIEDGVIDSFPTTFETKLVYDNPVYLKQEKDAYESYAKARSEREEAVRQSLLQRQRLVRNRFGLIQNDMSESFWRT